MIDFVRSIRFKLTVWFVGILALVILAISALLYFGLERVLLQSIDANLHTAGLRSVVPARSEDRSGATPEPGDPEVLAAEQLRQLMLLSNTPARLLTLDGNLLQSDPLFPSSITVTQEALDTASHGAARYETITVGAGTFRLYTAPIRINDTRAAIVQVIDSLDEQMNTLADVRALLLWLIPLSLILAGFGGSFLAGRALAPMTRVRRDVETIIEQSDLSHRVSEGLPDDEVGRLARTFDQLLDRVEQAMERERRFTSDASHELRTPLTVLKGEISVALSRPRAASQYRNTLTQLNTTVDDMSQLVEDLLALTRAAANRQAVVRVPVNIGDLVNQVCERLRVIADTKGIHLAAPAQVLPLVVMGDRIKLQRIFTNLIDNALRYTPKGGRVDIGVRREGEWVCVDVRDTGRGIASEYLANLFQRFYRADSGRARDSGGTGLGLAIAQAIARAHGGRIAVTSKLGQGSSFAVTLPLSDIPLAPALATLVDDVLPPPTTAANPTPARLPSVLHPMTKRTELHERKFRAMNTEIALYLLSEDTRHARCVLDAAEWFFVQVEWRLSRFRESSELSTLNRQGSLRASRMLFDVLQQAARAYDNTAGLFNPLIGAALAVAGYDRTFDDIGTDAALVRADHSPPSVPSFTDAITFDPSTHQVTLQHQAQLDLGGIAKGWAIDRAFRTLSRLGPCCLNAGGDVRAGGSYEPGGLGWRIDVADPSSADGAHEDSSTTPIRSMMVLNQAVATSGIMKRRWVANGMEQHHLIDPRSGQPARNGLLFVTAIADTAAQAEVAAKAAFVLGEDEGSTWLEARRIPALIMLRNGEYLVNEWFPADISSM